MRLYIGNKNYSSWSFRPWFAMTAKGIAFEEVLIPFNDEAQNPKFHEFSPTGKVPVLLDGDLAIWESLAILEYLAEKFVDAGFWPADQKARAHARSISNEMHGGFNALRNACPMNIRRKVGTIAVSDAVRKDVARIEAIWSDCLDKYSGPFLFGEISNADAMFAPVIIRLEVYALSDHRAVSAYSKAMKSHAAWQQWQKAALAETWTVPANEV